MFVFQPLPAHNLHNTDTIFVVELAHNVVSFTVPGRSHVWLLGICCIWHILYTQHLRASHHRARSALAHHHIVCAVHLSTIIKVRYAHQQRWPACAVRCPSFIFKVTANSFGPDFLYDFPFSDCLMTPLFSSALSLRLCFVFPS